MAAFPLGGPVPADHLVGHEILLDQLSGWLGDGFRVLLTGPRRCGKSSIARAAAERLEAHGVRVARVDLATCATLRQAAEGIVQACAAWLHDAAPVPMPEVDPGPEAAFIAALGRPERLARESGADACCLVLDGCDHLERLGGMDTLRRARPGLSQQQRTGLLLTGVHGLEVGRLAGTRGTPFALPIGIGPLPPEAWHGYIRREFAATGREVHDDGLTSLLEHTGGHPFDLMAVCRAVRARVVDGPAVAAAVREVLPMLRPLLLAEAVALGPTKHGILVRLASGSHLYREAGPPASIKRATDELVAAGVLRRGRRGVYGFTEPLMGEVLRGGPP